MECKFILEVFMFDCKCDYLPYYKKIVITIDENRSVADMLLVIKEDNKFFGYPTKSNASININGRSIFLSMKLKQVKKTFGKELLLEPLNSKRATKDLSINTDDFDNRVNIFTDFIDASDKRLFKTYIKEHYASPIINLEDEFIGDGLLEFAYDMIMKYPQHKCDILNKISKEDSGIWLHVEISNKLHPQSDELERKIIYLKNAILDEKSINNNFVNRKRNLRVGV